MVQAISDLVDASGFPRSMIRIEITESAFMKNQEFLKREVARFRESGFQVWMDDFGSEYSTLNLLQDLDVDLIKLDMQFMRSSSDSGKNLIIVSSIIDMAKQMGVATLVEGVESEEHLGILRAMGSDKLQGFLFGRPIPLDNIIDLTNDGNYIPFEKPTA
jgi:EAL domain-containing protein (putative c-di-GMP-specific phosphodiesterase class I)